MSMTLTEPSGVWISASDDITPVAALSGHRVPSLLGDPTAI